MKRLFLSLTLFVLLFAANSCSKDDTSDKVQGSITMKVDGEFKSFSNIHLQQTKSPDGRDTSLAIYTEDDGDDYGDMISATFMKGIFSDLMPFSYWVDDQNYARAANFSIHLTSNGNDKKLIGTFSGDLTSASGTKAITEGTINIQY